MVTIACTPIMSSHHFFLRMVPHHFLSHSHQCHEINNLLCQSVLTATVEKNYSSPVLITFTSMSWNTRPPLQDVLATTVEKSIRDMPSHRQAYMMVCSFKVILGYFRRSDIQRFPSITFYVLINFLTLELPHQQVLLCRYFLISDTFIY